MSMSPAAAGPGPSSLAQRASRAPSKSAEFSSSSDSSNSESDSDSDSDSDSFSDSDTEITQEYLDSLLEKARQNAQTRTAAAASATFEDGDDIIRIPDAEENPPLPALDPGPLPTPYITTEPASASAPDAPGRKKQRRRKIDTVVTLHDPDVARTAHASTALLLHGAPAPPAPPSEVDPKSGRVLTKRERKALKADTAGASWFDLPAPPPSELPRLYREVEALRLRNQLDPKRFYKKDEGESRGIKGLPKYFAIGTVVPTSAPFGSTASASNPRKRTLVDELVDDAEARGYAKKKFRELQGVRGARGRGTLRAKAALRRGKW